jgi:hypothetical protein
MSPAPMRSNADPKFLLSEIPDGAKRCPGAAYSTREQLQSSAPSAFLRGLRVKSHCATEPEYTAVSRGALYRDDRDSSTRCARSE